MSDIAEMAEIVHGYTMADINRAAGTVVTRHAFSSFMDYDERRAIAWHAVVVELFSRIDPPAFTELVRAGFDALSFEANNHSRHHGKPGPDGVRMKAFHKYWLPVKYEYSDGFSDRLVETLALRSALSVLTPSQYEAIATLAVFDNDGKAAAAALGLSADQFAYQVKNGRERINAVWYGDETPPAKRNPDPAKCRNGHSRAEHGHRDKRGTWVCNACQRAALRRHRAKTKPLLQVSA